MKPFFSIVIPTLNEEKYLPHLLSDISIQTFRDFEVIIADGKSSDGTIAQARSFTPDLKIVAISGLRRNVSEQRNTGASKATGQYLIFMDADNRLPHYFLEGLHYHIAVDRPNVFTTWCTSPDDKPMSKTITNALNLLIDVSKSIDYENAMGALIGFERATFKEGAGFDTDIKYAEDGECVRRYVRQGYSFSVFHDPQYVYSFRRFQSNGTLRTLQKSALLYMRQVTGGRVTRKDYPMGGHVFVKSRKTLKSAIEEIQEKIRKLIEE